MSTFVTWIGIQTLNRVKQLQHTIWKMLFRIATDLQEHLPDNSFSRNVSIILLGTISGQAIGVLLSPALTRLYSPEQFGTLGVYMSSLNTLVVVASLRYEIPISTARNATEAVNLFALATIVLVLNTTGLAVAAALVPRAMLVRAGVADLDEYRVLMPVGFTCLGANCIILYYVTWAQEFDVIARTRISQGLSGPISQIVMGLFGLGAGGLAAGFVIGQSSGTIVLFNRMVPGRAAMLRRISPRRIRQVAWRYRAFPLISAWAGLIDQAGSGQLIYILVAALYPGPVAGYLFISERVVARPLQMLSTSLLTVFMAEIGQKMHSDPIGLRRRFLQVTLRQLIVGVAWVLTIDSAAAFTFPFVFGSDWAGTLPFLTVMSLAYLINSVIASVGHTLQLLKRQSMAAVWQVGRAGAVSLGFFASVRGGLSAIQAIGVYVTVQIVFCALLFVLMRVSIEALQPAVPAADVT